MKKSELAQAKSLGDCAYIAIEKHFKKILKHEDDVLKGKDAEALHQMRVGMRRVRSAIAGFAPVIELPKAAEERKIGKVARTLGQLRDLDVLKEALEEQYQPELPKQEQKALKEVLDYLGKQRKKVGEKVHSTLKHKKYENLKESLQQWLKHPAYGTLAERPIGEILPDLLLPTVSKLFLSPAWQVGAKSETEPISSPLDLKREQVEKILVEQGHTLHTLRKQIKRLRYQMELFTHFYGADYAVYVEDLEYIQKVLGQIQDCFVLGDFLEEALGSKTHDQLPTLLEKLAQIRYQAWQDWQPLQQKYLNYQTRQGLYLTLLEQPSRISENDTLPEAGAGVNLEMPLGS